MTKQGAYHDFEAGQRLRPMPIKDLKNNRFWDFVLNLSLSLSLDILCTQLHNYVTDYIPYLKLSRLNLDRLIW